MSTKVVYPRGSVGGPAALAATSVVLALPNRPQAELLERLLQQAGFEVWHARSARESRRIICTELVTMAVLATELSDESGWLTCAKLTRTDPEMQVVLLGRTTPRNRRFAAFVGAAALLPNVAAVAEWFSDQ